MMEIVTNMVPDKFALIRAGVDVPNAEETKAMVEIRKICFDDAINATMKLIHHKEKVEIPEKEKTINKLNACIQTLDNGGDQILIDPKTTTEFRAPIKFLKDRSFMLAMAKTECSKLRAAIQHAEEEAEDLKTELKKRIITQFSIMAAEKIDALLSE